MECGFVRCGSVPEATISEAVPASHEASCKRLHRWGLAEHQIPRKGGYARTQSIPFGQLIILQNVIASLWASALAITVILATLCGTAAVLATLGVVLLPCYVSAFMGTVDAVRGKGGIEGDCAGHCPTH